LLEYPGTKASQGTGIMNEIKKTSARICVRELCGLGELTAEDGKKIHKLILNHWGMVKRVEVDLARAVPSAAFLDEAIGLLIWQFKKDEIVSKLKVAGLSAPDRTLLNGIVVARYQSFKKHKAERRRLQSPS